MPDHLPPGSRPVENAISRLLRVALAIAVLLGVTAFVLLLTEVGDEPVSFEVFRPLPDDLRSPAGIVSGAFAGDHADLVQLAVLLLLLTPIARELVAVSLLARRREWPFVAVGAVALLIMIYGLLPGS